MELTHLQLIACIAAGILGGAAALDLLFWGGLWTLSWIMR